jgi:hypothetical protein
MTKSMFTTPCRFNEALTVAHTPVSYLFTKLLSALDACTAAEHALQRDVADIFVPDCYTALTAAEMSREALMINLDDVIGMPEQRGLDRPLRLMAVALKTLLSIEDDADRGYLFTTLTYNAHLLQVQGAHPTAKAVRHLQQRYFQSCTLLMAMQDFGGPGPDDGGAFSPQIAA